MPERTLATVGMPNPVGTQPLSNDSMQWSSLRIRTKSASGFFNFRWNVTIRWWRRYPGDANGIEALPLVESSMLPPTLN